MAKTPSYSEIRNLRHALAVYFNDPEQTGLSKEDAVGFLASMHARTSEDERRAAITEDAPAIADYADSQGIDANRLRRFLKTWNPMPAPDCSDSSTP